MKWPRLAGKNFAKPSGNDYTKWKNHVANKCENSCVYCAVTEAKFGGVRNFHIDHFRPKSRYPLLTNDFDNLVFACAICNCFKGDDWPRDPTEEDSVHYPDPTRTDFNEVLSVGQDFRVTSARISGRYLVARLHLNRAQLVLARRYSSIERRWDAITEFFAESDAPVDGGEDALRALADAAQALIRFARNPPYSTHGTR